MRNLACIAFALALLAGCATSSALREEYREWPLKPWPIEDQSNSMPDSNGPTQSQDHLARAVKESVRRPLRGTQAAAPDSVNPHRAESGAFLSATAKTASRECGADRSIIDPTGALAGNAFRDNSRPRHLFKIA